MLNMLFKLVFLLAVKRNFLFSTAISLNDLLTSLGFFSYSIDCKTMS